MKTIIKTLSVVIFAAIMFTACSKGDNGVIVYRTFVTVENPDSVKTFYMKTDAGLLFYTQTNSFIPAHRSRLIIDFIVEEEMPKGSDYNYEVKITDYNNVLTKEIITITPEMQDSIGNDPIAISNLWIASDYLSMEFMVYTSNSNTKHLINLVADTSKHYDDDALHFELRHNAYKDQEYYRGWSYASFNLLPLKEAATGDSLTFVIHSKEHGNVEKTQTIGYKFSTEPDKSPKLKSYNISNSSFSLFR